MIFGVSVTKITIYIYIITKIYKPRIGEHYQAHVSTLLVSFLHDRIFLNMKHNLIHFGNICHFVKQFSRFVLPVSPNYELMSSDKGISLC